ncbi:MAG: hypothetical protein J0L99_02665 [Chitinophagales bacterium]|nr:hypothetical protein [Chitinophagales bacterium]
MLNSENLIVSQRKPGNLLTAFFLLAVVIVIIWLLWIDRNLRYFPYNNAFLVLIGSLFLFYALSIFWNFFTRITINDDALEAQTLLWNKRILWSDMTRADFTPLDSRDKSVPRCRIYSTNGMIELNGYFIKNYEQIEQRVLKIVKAQKTPRQKGTPETGRITRITFIVAAIIFAALLILEYFVTPKDNPQSLSLIQIVLNAPPEALTSGKQRKTYAYVFPENQYPEFNFQIEDQLYYALKERKQLQAGDTLELHIPTAALRKKLLRKEEPTFWEKHIDWPKINVYHFKQLNP